ncbi:hypothetical protein D039_0668A, partial [Vibrio parahaemolyticus EKP-028]
MLNTC